MRAIHLSGLRRLESGEYAEPEPPAAGEVLIRVDAVGICGSDLHMYETGRIGTTVHAKPFVPGHEFMGTVVQVGTDAADGNGGALRVKTRVAVDPQVACHRCEWCEAGHPNLCPHHTFLGVFPTDGALRERMLVPARNCFPIPDEISDGGGAALETLGVALHAIDLSHIRLGWSGAVIGCGPVGLLIVRLARLAGVASLVAVDPLSWRAEQARAFGATHIIRDRAENCTADIMRATGGRGCDIVLEAAAAGPEAQAAMEVATPGGRVVLVGIPPDDRLTLTHSVARRKGLSVIFSRRMKHVYPRSIALASGPRAQVDLDGLITHEFPLERTAEAFELHSNHQDGVVKSLVRPNQT
ncbi:MAG TPA: alcohol dehydrogenase catalytic domain-containing protein [Opitutaceae bacterium]